MRNFYPNGMRKRTKFSELLKAVTTDEDLREAEVEVQKLKAAGKLTKLQKEKLKCLLRLL